MGEDPALTDADANHVRKALGSLDFLVAQEPLHDRDRQVRRRVPAGRLLCRKGRHVHQHRAPRAARAQGGRAAGPVSRRLGDHRRPLPPPGPRDALRLTRADLRRDALAGADLRGHDLCAHRQGRPAVALPRRRPSRHAVPARRVASRAARACCRASSTKRPPSSAATSTPSCSPPGACSITTTS